MNQIGVTKNSIRIMEGVGQLYFQEGLPLSIIFDKLIANNMMPSWLHLYAEMKANGMSHKRIIHLLNENVFDSYGKHFRDTVISRLQKYIP